MDPNLLVLIYIVLLGVIPGSITYYLRSSGRDDIFRPMCVVVLVIILLTIAVTGIKPDAGPKFPFPLPYTHEGHLVEVVFSMFGIVGTVLLILGIAVGYLLAELKQS
jgi:hypothetical protein